MTENEDAETREAKALREFAESSGSILSFIDAYRVECTQHGYSAEAAEKMAVDMHSYIIQSLRQTLAREAAKS